MSISRKDVGYVDLDDSAATEGASAFFFERRARASFPPAWSDAPHRHNFQEIIVVESGEWRHSVDGHVSDVVGPAVSLIGKGQIHVVVGGADLTIYVIRFADEFLPASLISRSWNYHATLFNQLGPKQTIALQPAEMRDLKTVLDLIEAEYARPASFQQENMLRHLLSILIIRVERIHQGALAADPHRLEEYDVYQQFMALLDQDFARHHAVEHYATSLGIAPIKLSKLLGRVVGRSTKQLIDERIVLEAKRYLHYTDMSIKEIAFALGYGDLFHFSKTFKRLADVAPQAYREQWQKKT